MCRTRIRLATLALGTILLLIAGTTIAYAKSIVVDPAGGAGTETSISAAIAGASDGDTIIVHSGLYNENVRVDKRLTLTGIDTGGGRPVVDGGGPAGRGELGDVTITATDVVLQGFNIRNGPCGIAINSQFDPSVTGITVFDNWVSDVSNSIVIDFSSGNNITGNTVSRSIRGVVIDTNDNVISGNRIFDMSESGIIVSFTGNRNLIVGNTVYDCGDAGIEIAGPANIVHENTINDSKMGIFISDLSNDVEGNTVHGNDDGLHLQQAYDCRITGNAAYANGYGLRLLSSRNNSITNNTFRDNREEAVFGDDTLGFNNLSSNPGATLPLFRYYSDGSPYIAPSTPIGHGATVQVGGPEGRGTGNNPCQIATVVWPVPPDSQIVYVNLYCTPMRMSFTDPGTGWGTLTYAKAKAAGCVSV